MNRFDRDSLRQMGKVSHEELMNSAGCEQLQKRTKKKNCILWYWPSLEQWQQWQELHTCIRFLLRLSEDFEDNFDDFDDDFFGMRSPEKRQKRLNM